MDVSILEGIELALVLFLCGVAVMLPIVAGYGLALLIREGVLAGVRDQQGRPPPKPMTTSNGRGQKRRE